MSILRGARKVVIQDAQFNAYDNRVTNSSQPAANFGTITPESVLHILQSHSAIAGLLNASEQFDAPKCDPDTRASIIETITNWVQAGTSSSSSSMFWLRGPAGVGKSAVAQAVALLLEQEEDLAASFFFSRTAPGRNNGNMLIVTLAYQIAMNFPPTRTYIARNIKRNPSIFTLSNKVQIQKLIVEPVNRVRKSFTYRFSNLLFFLRWNQPRLIVVDGLDECDDLKVQCDLLLVIGQAIQQLQLPFRFLITSRPESQILSTFELDPLFQAGNGIDVTQKDLGEDHDANHDIRTFLRKAFSEIRRTHPLRDYLPEIWPTFNEIELLVQKSSASFIYPATVIRYIQSPLLRPDDCLKVILGLSAIPDDDRPYGQLDDLYIYIFKSTPDKHKKSIKLIFDILVIPRSKDDNLGAFTTPAMLDKLLFFPPGHVEHILGNLLCLVNLHGRDKPIKVLHASLSDFLLDLSRSGEFYADMGRAHEALAKGYTKLILDAKPNEFHSMVNSYYLPAERHSKRAFLSGLEQDQAYASLDELYIHIFSSAPNGLKGSLKLNFTALALLAFPDHDLFNGFQTQAIKEKLLSLSPSYVEYVRSHLHFLVDHPLQISDHSVLEFFLTPHRSGKLGVNVAHGHEFLARRYAALIRDENSTTDTWYYPLHFIYHSERAFLSGDLEKELEEFDLANIYRTFTNGNRVFDGVWTYSMVITILNSFFHLLQRKEITNGQSLFDDHIELLEQCILSPRRGLPDIDLDLYSRMLNQIRSRHLVYDCSESARSGNHPCSSCRDDVRGAPEAVYKLKVLITVAWYSSAEYSMDSKTPSGLRRAHMVKQCMRSLQTLGDIHANHDSVAIHLEFARLSLTQSSYSTSLADYLDSFAESKSGNSQALLTALSKDHPSEVSTLAFAVQAYIQRFESAIQPDLLKRLKKRWSHVSVDAASAAHDDVANGVNSNAPLAQNLPGSFNTRRPFNQSGRTSHRRGGIWNINMESGRTRK